MMPFEAQRKSLKWGPNFKEDCLLWEEAENEGEAGQEIPLIQVLRLGQIQGDDKDAVGSQGD